MQSVAQLFLSRTLHSIVGANKQLPASTVFFFILSIERLAPTLLVKWEVLSWSTQLSGKIWCPPIPIRSKMGTCADVFALTMSCSVPHRTSQQPWKLTLQVKRPVLYLYQSAIIQHDAKNKKITIDFETTSRVCRRMRKTQFYASVRLARYMHIMEAAYFPKVEP